MATCGRTLRRFYPMGWQVVLDGWRYSDILGETEGEYLTTMIDTTTAGLEANGEQCGRRLGADTPFLKGAPHGIRSSWK